MSSSNGFKNAIKKFDGEFPVSHIEYEESSNLPSNINAITIPPLNFLITIKLNKNKYNRPNISIARTIVHEIIHAEMFRKIMTLLDNGGDLNGLTKFEWKMKWGRANYTPI